MGWTAPHGTRGKFKYIGWDDRFLLSLIARIA